MQQFRQVSRTRTIYSTETHTSDFILNTFWNGKPVQFFKESCWVVVTGCQENKSCSEVLNWLERLDNRIRCNKSLGCIFSEKPVDWTTAFKLEISIFLQIFMMCFFMDSFESRMNPRFLAESEKGMLWEPRVIEWGRGMVEGFKEDEKGKRRASVLSSLSLSWY